ncbi:MAG: TonB-dependent receptor, partial [Bacteroidales bacterium]|nr:TonB-dependent receptor [Bacteroidales bacterium]
MKKLFCMTLMILGMMSMAFAADAKGGIRGIVIDASSREALEFVNVAVREAGSDEFKSGCATDIEGRFLVENLKAGNYKVVISFVGYKSSERTVKVDNEVLNMGRIFIEEDAQQMREVQVTAQQSTMKFEIDKKVFNVGTDIASKGASATDILENIPSIEIDQEGAISLRGSSSVNVWINGKASGLTAENRGDILEQMPAENIERVEIITNPGAKYSAEGTAGIINIILKENARAGYYGSVKGGFNHHNGAP